MSERKFVPVAFVNSDIMIKAFVESNRDALTKLLTFSNKMNVEDGEKFLITEFVINDVITEAYKKGIRKDKLLELIYPSSTIYFQTVSVPSYVLKLAISLLNEAPDDIKLTLTEWSGLLMMLDWNIDTIISDNREIDKVIHDPDFHTLIKKGIKRI